jgi:hypothetical protein
MPSVKYRLFFNNISATQEKLDRFEDITVSQGMGTAWEAQLQMPIVTDEKGRWLGEADRFIADFNPVRIEVQVGDGDFVPLIDGPILGSQRELNAEPGRSLLTIRVQDDSYYLNQEEKQYHFERLRDDEIATRLFQEFPGVIKERKIDPTPTPLVTPIPDVVRRGTAMHLLRFLADRQSLNAYVLPGSQPGHSIGCFQELPTRTDGLPSLVLLGSDRNVFNFNPNNDSQQPTRFRAYALGLSDKRITRSDSDLAAVPRLGKTPTTPPDSAVQLLRPRHGDTVDLDRWVAAETLRASYSISATGSVVADCYAGVLSPYRLIQVCGANTRESGTYLISRVTHRLTRSQYSQEFTLRRNAQSEESASNNNAGIAVAAGVGISFSFNVQGRIF